jgi:hypothetical protein
MPVITAQSRLRTHAWRGFATLAETVGSVASIMVVDPEHYCVGIEINANLRSVKDVL